MWIYTKNGFYSIVQDKTDPDYLIVRARIKGDLEAIWPENEIFDGIKETPNNDYRYRVRLRRDIVANQLADEAMDINYPNFKDSISDKRRSPYYSTVWAAMLNMQEDLTFDTNKK